LLFIRLSPSEIFRNTVILFTVRSVKHLAQTPGRKTTPCRLYATGYFIYSHYSPYLEAVPPTSAIRGQLGGGGSVNAVMSLRFPQNALIFLTSTGRTLLHVVGWLFNGNSEGEKPRDEPMKLKQSFCFLRHSRAYRIARVQTVVKFVCPMICLLST